MKRIALAAAAVLAALGATAASAQVVYYERVYDPYSVARSDFYAGRQECWNPRAGHFEEVRPGEYQDDLDFSRCRVAGTRYADPYYDNRYYDNRYYGRWDNRWRAGREECWNPRAGHFEEVRPGEWQDDLDRSRCRMIAWR